MNFKEFSKLIYNNFVNLTKTGKLYRSEINGSKVWETYINNFTKENNPIFRDPNSSTHECNLCNNFIRRYGNIVAIDANYNIITMFDIELSEDNEYYNSCKAISELLKSNKIANVFFETFSELNSLPYESCKKSNSVFRLGIEKNPKQYSKEEAEKFGVVKPNEIREFNHFHLDLPKQFVDTGNDSIERIMADYRDNKNVFQRAMNEIPLDSYKLMIDLINQGSLPSSEQYIPILNEYVQFVTEYNNVSNNQKDNWCWNKSYELRGKSKFLGTLQGEFLKDVSEGKELQKSCDDYNKRNDSANWGIAKKALTQGMKDAVTKLIKELGCEKSFERRHATMDDILVDEIRHINVDNDTVTKEATLFDKLTIAKSTRFKRAEFDKVETVTIDKFMTDILPTCTSVELFLENKHERNLCNITTALDDTAPNIFKYGNLKSKTFNGNLAGKSQIKEEVKTKGGKVDGVLRFSMMWADGNQDNSDLDLHCVEPNRFEIYFGNKRNPTTGGNLDIDITQPNGKLAVENITFPSLSRMTEGVYKLFIRQFSARGSKGFKAEIEFNDELYSYTYDKPVQEDIQIAEVTLKNGVFTIVHKLPVVDGIGVVKTIYNLETNQFHKVNLICLSPNYWGESNVGIKHYMFMLQNCKTDVPSVSFHTEDLLPELAKNNAAMRDLAYMTMIEPTNKQLAGLGFNSTVKDEIILKLTGSFKRVVKIQI